MCPGTLLWLLENTYLKRPVAPPSPGLGQSTGYASLRKGIHLITFLAWTRRQVDVSLRQAVRRAQSLGCHSSLSGSPVTMTTPLTQVAMEHNLTWIRFLKKNEWKNTQLCLRGLSETGSPVICS